MNIQRKTSIFTPGAPTLEDVKIAIMASASISPAKKSELVSAINSSSLWCHRTPAEIPADYNYIDRLFERLTYGTLGVGRARFRNVRSLVKQALNAAGLAAWTGKTIELTPAWASLRDGIEDRYARDCLARFFRYCSADGIAPEDVDDAVVERFLEVLVNESVPKPEVSVQSAIRLWNRMVDRVPGWAQMRLTPLRRREFYSLKPEQLHPDLAADIERCCLIMSGQDPTHPLTPRRPLKRRSVKKREYEILQLISGMHHGGVDVGALRSLADLCNVDLVRKGLTFHIERHRQRLGKDADPRASTMIGGIADVIRIIGKHYVEAPAPVVRELTRIASGFSRRSKGMTEKNRARLNQLESPLILRKFLSHALIEMGKLARKSKITRRDAIRYSVVLATEILIVAPMRIDNLAALDLDENFVWSGNAAGELIIVVPRRLVKNGIDLQYKIPRGSMPAFEKYLKRFRPLLVNGQSSALFPGRRGRNKRSDSLSRQIKDLIRKELGLDWTAHIYRHLAARLYLHAYPGDYEGARRLLAHLSAETTYRFYEGEEMRPALDRFDAVIASHREQDAFNAVFRDRYRAPKKEG